MSSKREKTVLAERGRCWQREDGVGRERTVLAERRRCWQREDGVGREKTTVDRETTIVNISPKRRTDSEE